MQSQKVQNCKIRNCNLQSRKVESLNTRARKLDRGKKGRKTLKLKHKKEKIEKGMEKNKMKLVQSAPLFNKHILVGAWLGFKAEISTFPQRLYKQ